MSRPSSRRRRGGAHTATTRHSPRDLAEVLPSFFDPRGDPLSPRRAVRFAEIEDRRFWPGPAEALYSPAKRLSGARAHFDTPRPKQMAPSGPFWGKRNKPVTLSPVVAFRAPQSVLVCVRRQVRREVLHAKGVAGGSGRISPPRRSEFSSISCRR